MVADDFHDVDLQPVIIKDYVVWDRGIFSELKSDLVRLRKWGFASFRPYFYSF